MKKLICLLGLVFLMGCSGTVQQAGEQASQAVINNPGTVTMLLYQGLVALDKKNANDAKLTVAAVKPLATAAIASFSGKDLPTAATALALLNGLWKDAPASASGVALIASGILTSSINIPTGQSAVTPEQAQLIVSFCQDIVAACNKYEKGK